MANLNVKLKLPLLHYQALKRLSPGSFSAYVKKSLQPYLDGEKALQHPNKVKPEVHTTSFNLPYKDYVKLKELCDAADMPLETAIRLIVLQHLEEESKDAALVQT